MITADFDGRHNRLTVSGHAGAAPKGEDLICAGVTTLVEALAAALDDLERRGWLDWKEVSLGEGKAEIQAYGKPSYKVAVHSAFWVAVCGMRWIGIHYPEYLCINIH